MTGQGLWLRRRLLGLATLVMVVITLTVVVIGPLLGRGDDVAGVIGLGSAFTWTWNLLRLPLLFVAVACWPTVVFHRAPNARIPGARPSLAL